MSKQNHMLHLLDQAQDCMRLGWEDWMLGYLWQAWAVGSADHTPTIWRNDSPGRVCE